MANETKQDVAVSTKSSRPEAARPGPAPMPVFRPIEEVERMFGRLLPRNWMAPTVWEWPMWGGLSESLGNVRVPQVDVIDRDKDYLVRIEMPGVEKKDIDVSVSDGTLVVKGCTAHETKEEKHDYYRCEISRGNFSRSLMLPNGVDSANISAALKDGILEIVLPKEEGVQRHSVKVL